VKPGPGSAVEGCGPVTVSRARVEIILNKEHFSALERLATFAAKGGLARCIERSCSLAEVPEAIRQLEAGKVRGQIVISSSVETANDATLSRGSGSAFESSSRLEPRTCAPKNPVPCVRAERFPRIA
jgi:hypothetical protein